MATRVELREVSNEEGNRLLRIVRRDSGSVVTWRRAQVVLLAAQRMPPGRIAEVAFTDADTVRDVIHNFNRDGFDALYPRYRGRPAAHVHAAGAPADQADRGERPVGSRAVRRRLGERAEDSAVWNQRAPCDIHEGSLALASCLICWRRLENSFS
jgi:Helix-turn-helix domain